MSEQFERLKRIIGENAFERLRSSKVAVFGIGGVGGYVCEALARSGIGHIMIIDNDTVDTTNLNRQIIALHSTIGRKKTEVMEERLKDIDPDIEVIRKDCFYLPENSDETDLSDADYIVDAVDTVEKSRPAGHILHGHRQQDRSLHASRSGHFENENLPPRESHEKTAEGQRDRACEGSLFRRSPSEQRRRTHSGKYGFRTVFGGTDDRGGNSKGVDRWVLKFIRGI